MTVPPNPPPPEDSGRVRTPASLDEARRDVEAALARLERSEPGWLRRLQRRLWRFTLWSVLVVYLVFCGAVLTLRHVVLPDIRNYRVQIEQAVSSALRLPVRIADLDAGWQGLRPRLSLKQVTVYDKDGRQALLLPEVNAIISWERAAVGRFGLDSLEIIRPDVDVRRDADGQITVAGLTIDNTQQDGGFSEWLLAQREIVVRGARLRWNDEQRKAPELALADVHFLLQRSGRQHRFGLYAMPPAHLAAPIDVRGRFETPAFGVATDIDRWRGELYLRAANADLAAWPAWFDYPVELSRGHGALRAWLAFTSRETTTGSGRRLFELTADLRLTNLATRLKNDLPPLQVAAVNGRLRARTLTTGHELLLRDFSLDTGDGLAYSTRSLTERYSSASAGKPEQGEFQTDRINLETLALVAERLPVNENLRRLLNQYQPRGSLANVSFKWQGPIEAPLSYDLSSSFEGLAILPQAAAPGSDGAARVGRPGFTNLGGKVIANAKGGTLTLASTGATLRLPGVFAEPDVRLNKLAGDVRWTRDGDNLEVRLPALEFANEDATGSASIVWRHGPNSGAVKDGPGWLELDARLGRVDVRRVPRYLPLVTGNLTRSWLANAIVSGTSTDTVAHLSGDLNEFPFREVAGGARVTRGALDKLIGRNRTPTKAGEFRIVTRLRDVRFDYGNTRGQAPQWPLLEETQAELIFNHFGMQVRNASGNIGGVRFERTRADFDDLSDPNLTLRVAGNLSGALQDVVRFTNVTPVGGWIGGFLNNARTTGNATLDLRLELPINHMERSKVAGGITLANNDVTLVQQGLPIMQRVAGRVDFTESGVTLRNIAGQFLGGPFRLDGGARPDGQINIRGEGSMQATTMRRLADNPFLARLAERLEGNTRYGVTLNLRPREAANGATAQVTVDSNLSGLAIDLPPPFRKAAGETLALKVELIPQPRGAEELRINLGPAFAAVFERKPNAAGEMAVTRAAYGINEAAVLTDYAGYANVNLRSLDVDAWQTVISQLAPAAATRAPGATGVAANNFLPDVIAVRTGELRVFEKTLANVVLAASRNGDTWQANMSADQVSGYFTWRDAPAANQPGRVTARLARLIIPQSATTDVSSLLASSPRELPNLDIVADQFELRGKKLGRLELQADNVRGAAREWRVQKLNITNDDATFDATGAWTAGANNTRTMALNVNLAAGNAGKLLERFGLADTLRAGTPATLKGEVRWRGSPFDIDYQSLGGKISLEAERGQFLKADPGIGKLLSVLSLQALPRRITLDFRDVFSEGFAFDSIRATANIENGVAHTKDFNMRGVAATVLIEGSADLAHETQNLHVLVLPQFNAATGSLAYALLANPVVGLATFLAQAILRDPLSKAFSFEYNVTGSWSEPTIAKVERQTSPSVTPDAPPPGSPAPTGPAR